MNDSDDDKRQKDSSKHEEAELLIRVKNGDKQAFTTLYNMHKNMLLGYLQRKTNSTEDSEDILQDIFLKILIESENLDKIENFNAYIFKLAQNKVIDYFRKSSRWKFMTLDIDIVGEKTFEDILLDKEKQRIIQDAVNHLSPQQKKIYQLRREQGKHLKDIAEEMNLSLSTVQNHMNQALKNIYEYLDKKNYF